MTVCFRFYTGQDSPFCIDKTAASVSLCVVNAMYRKRVTSIHRYIGLPIAAVHNAAIITTYYRLLKKNQLNTSLSNDRRQNYLHTAILSRTKYR